MIKITNYSKDIIVNYFRMGIKFYKWYLILGCIAIFYSPINILLAESFRMMVNSAAFKNVAFLKEGIIFAIIAVIMQAILSFGEALLMRILEDKSLKDLQNTMLKKILYGNFKEVNIFHSADILNRLLTSAKVAQTGLNFILVKSFSALILLSTMLIYLSILNLKLTIGIFIISLFIPIILSPFSKLIKKLNKEKDKLIAETEQIVQESIQGAEIIESYSLNGQISTKFSNQFNKLIKKMRSLFIYPSIIEKSSMLLDLVGFIFIIWFGGILVFKGEIEPGVLVAFLISFGVLSTSISTLSGVWLKFQESLAAFHRVWEVIQLNEEKVVLDKHDFIPEGDISFQNIDFEYKDNKNILSDISFSAEKGQITAIIGPSGSGKSTIAKLLLRLYEPNNGSIKIGTTSIKDININDWRKKIGYVSQESLIFNGTIRENIMLGKMDATEEEIIEAAIKANIHDLILSLPNGYDTEVNINSFSGGEKQRLSIARAFLMNPDILLLDEPTASLDSENEYLILQSLNELISSRTTIIITHRIPIIKNAHKVVFIENGKVLDQGNYNEMTEKIYSLNVLESEEQLV